MIKFLVFLILLFNASFIAAQEENKSVQKITTSEYGHKVNNFTLEFLLASEQVKSSSTHKVNGQYSSVKSSLLYTQSENDEFRLFASYVKEDYDNYEDLNYFEFGELMYRRKGILNYTDHGVNLDFELKQGFVMDSKIRKYWGFDSESIPQIILKKRLPNQAGVEFKARHHFYHRNSTKNYTLAHEDRLYISAYQMFAEKFIFNFETKYRHKIYTGAHYSHELGGPIGINHEDLVIHPSLMYFFGHKILLEGYLETKINDSFDQRKISKLAKDELVFGAALYLTVL